MSTITRIIFVVTLIPVVLYILICASLFLFQRSLIYHPQPGSNRTASPLITIPVAGGKIQVSGRSHAGPAAVLYFGGNAEDVSEDISDLGDTFPSAAIYALHYPGYGGASGSPSEKAIFADSLSLFDRVYAEHHDVTVIGRSLGSAVAVWVASQRPLSRLVLITPFDSLADAATQQFPYLPVRLLLRDKFDSWKYAPKVAVPTRIIVAEKDELIPRSSTDRLRVRFANGLVSYFVVADAGHNDIQNKARYWELVSGR